MKNPSVNKICKNVAYFNDDTNLIFGTNSPTINITVYPES